MSQPWFKVKATDVWVVDNTPDPELTLTACHPKGSAEFRIVDQGQARRARASRISITKPIKTGAAAQRSQQHALAEGLSGRRRACVPTIFFGILAAIVGIAWWWAFRRWRLPRTWLIGVLFFLVALFPFYVYLERALPAGY